MSDTRTQVLIARHQTLEAKIGSVESGLRYYPRSATPAETGEDQIPAWRAELVEIKRLLGWPA